MALQHPRPSSLHCRCGMAEDRPHATEPCPRSSGQAHGQQACPELRLTGKRPLCRRFIRTTRGPTRRCCQHSHWSHARVGRMSRPPLRTAAKSSLGTDSLDGRASPQGWTPSQGHGAALHGGSSCKVRWSMLPRPQRAQLSAAHCPRRAGVERSTSSTSSFNASTGTASAWRRPPALLGRRPDATTGRLGPPEQPDSKQHNWRDGRNFRFLHLL